MAKKEENFVLEYLKAIRASIERTEQDVKDIKFRITQVEETLVHLTGRFDRLDDRVERIEKRLDLVEA